MSAIGDGCSNLLLGSAVVRHLMPRYILGLFGEGNTGASPGLPPQPLNAFFNPGFALQVEDLIRKTSQTLQLLIEHDPVSQRLGRLRLDSRLPPRIKKPSSPCPISPLDLKENLQGTLRRRSLRYRVTVKLPSLHCSSLDSFDCKAQFIGLVCAF